MRLLRRAAVTVGLVEIGGSVALLAAMVGLICYQVTARYLFRAPLAWVEELATYCFIWMTLLGAGLATKLGRQIRIQTLDHVMSPRAQVKSGGLRLGPQGSSELEHSRSHWGRRESWPELASC